MPDPSTVDIPNRTHEDFGDSLAKHISVVNGIIKCDEEEIILDFSNARMLNAFFLGGLVCLINRLQDQGKKFTLNHNANYSISSCLDTIRFPKTFSPVNGKEQDYLKALENYSHKTYIPIISFKTGPSYAVTLVRENVMSAVSQLLKN